MIIEASLNGHWIVFDFSLVIIQLSMDHHQTVVELSLNYHWVVIESSLNYLSIIVVKHWRWLKSIEFYRKNKLGGRKQRRALMQPSNYHLSSPKSSIYQRRTTNEKLWRMAKQRAQGMAPPPPSGGQKDQDSPAPGSTSSHVPTQPCSAQHSPRTNETKAKDFPAGFTPSLRSIYM